MKKELICRDGIFGSLAPSYEGDMLSKKIDWYVC